MNTVEGTVLTLEDLVHIPSRLAFLDAPKVKACRNTITQQRGIEFLPIHIWESYLPEKNGVMSLDKYAFRMYKVMMFGILKSGEKITVVLDGVLPFFEIRVPKCTGGSETEHHNKFMTTIKKIVEKENYKVKQYKVVSGATIKEYGDSADFVQLSFSSIGERSKAIIYFDAQGFETAHDDASCYYRMLCRDSLTSWTSWVTLSGYRTVKTHKFFSTVYTLLVPHENVKAFTGDIFADRDLKNDLTIECCFDIETYEADPNQMDDIPQPTSKTADMFKISMAFVTIDGDIAPANVVTENGNRTGLDPSDTRYDWKRPAGHLISYDISMALTKAMPGRVVVHCRNMSEMILAFGIIWNQMQPDYAPNFNGDTYDWRWIAEKARQYNLLEFLERNMSLANLALYRQVEDKKFVNPSGAFTHISVEGRSWGGYSFWYKYRMKLSAELQVPGACLNYPGYVCIDMMMQLRAAYANPDRYSLHFFLQQLELGDKVDMPYKEMFRAWAHNKDLIKQLQPLADMRWTTVESRAQAIDVSGALWRAVQASAHDMLRVGEYCIVDSLRCHDLLIKTQLIRDKRQVGALSYTTMDDCVYRANGMKVRNMIIAKAQSRDLHVSNRQPKKIEIGKYPGAYVFPPKKGVATAKPSPVEMRASEDPQYAAWRAMSEEDYQRILIKIRTNGVWYDNFTQTFTGDLAEKWPVCFIEWLQTDTHYPIAGLDFSSLYPSLIMAYNLSPEMIVHSLERAIELAGQGKSIHPINFKFNGRDIKGWSVRSMYPEQQSSIDCLMKRIQQMIKSDDPNGTEESALLRELELLLNQSEFGLFPTVLKMLFDQRVGLKAELKPINKQKEHIEAMPNEEFCERAEEYKDVMFRWNYLNSKQKALKVFMNTFYGEAGNSLSPLRVLALAGGVTSSGVYNIKMVAKFVQDLSCRIYYGDTDSVYMSMPRATFSELDRQYYSAKITKQEYFRNLVTESFKAIKIINKKVNDMLEADNGTKFLNMAFEEFLYPAVFSGKKKYGGIAHEGEFNENPKKIFVRGFEYVKKGTSEMLKDISLAILWKVLSTDNIESLIKIVEDKIQDVYSNPASIDFKKFVKTASYKPNKKNVAVHTFVERMRPLGLAPEALDRFSYVIVKKYPFKYDVRGRKSELSVGDRMEFADRAQKLNMEIDLDYYMSSGVCGQLSRFVSYHSRFDVTPHDDSDDAYTEAELKNIKCASKYITNCYAQWSQKHHNKGPALRNLFKKVNHVFHDEFSSVLKVSELWQFDSAASKGASKADQYDIQKDKSQMSYEDNQCLFTNIQLKVEKQAAMESKKEAGKLIALMDCTSVEEWAAKQKVYRILLAERESMLRRQMPQLLTTLRNRTVRLRKLFMKRDTMLENCIAGLTSVVGADNENFDTLEPILQRIESLDESKIRSQLSQDIVRNVTHADLITLNEIDTLYLRMLALYKKVKVTGIVVSDLNDFLHSKLGDVSRVHQIDHLKDLDEWMSANLI